jgi:Flp pilus assembly protein CpaB
LKKNRIAILIGEIGLVIICAGGFYVMNQKQIQPMEVYQYSRDIPVNTQVTASDLKKVTLPATAVDDTLFARNSKDIIGKYVDTKVFAGENVLGKQLVEKDSIDPFDSMDLTKYRKISIPITYVDGLGGNIKHGDKVDLVYTASGKKSAGGTQTDFQYSRVFLENVAVFNITTEDGTPYQDKTQAKQETASTGKDISSGGDSAKMSTITLAVTLDQAEEISARLKAGTIRVVGRFDSSKDYQSTGYIIGDYDKINSSAGLAETNK